MFALMRFLGVCLLLMLMGFRVEAATYTVTLSGDENNTCASGSGCSLREAINDASSGDTIAFSVSSVTFPSGVALSIDKTLTFSGGGISFYTIGSTRALQIAGSSTITVTFNNMNFSESVSGSTGGVLSISNTSATININNCSFSNNTTTGNGGAILITSSATVNIANSLFNANSATGTGGAIQLTANTLNINNSTFTDNLSTATTGGGAINSGGTLNIKHSTIVNNSVTGSGSTGGGVRRSAGGVNIYNSIIADNTANTTANNNCGGTITTLSNSFTNPSGGCSTTGNTTGTSADLAALSGFTRIPNISSPVLDKILSTDSNCTALTTDQLGNPRPDSSGANCDIGAVELKKYTLTVTKTGSGTVDGTANSANVITCGADCNEKTYENTSISLTATPNAGYSFSNWTGDCSGSISPLTVTLTANKTCDAVFTASTNTLNISKIGTGAGTVTGTGGINCGATCLASLTPSTAVTLTATPDANSVFAGWSGTGCSVSFTISSDMTCTATFNSTNTLTVTKIGTGTGTITGTGINCDASNTDCNETVTTGTNISITATTNAGSTFAGWSGDCSGSTTPYSVTVSADKTCTATFNLTTNTLTVTKIGTGAGTITGTGINCDASNTDCNETVTTGNSISITATANTGSTFAGWSGDCSGSTTPYSVTVSADKTCTATFNSTNTLTVTKTGTGTGTITGTGINCDASNTDCNETVTTGNSISITATANAGSTFAGWSGDCSGMTNPFSITITGDKTCTALFSTSATTKTLVVTKTGLGTITSAGSEINCGADCNESVAVNSSLVLTATPSAGYSFTGWSGDCTGASNPLTVTLDNNKSCAATFTVITNTLAVTIAGTGSGVVEGTGIDCGTDCDETVNQGTSISLTATPDGGSIFAGWSGDCSGSTSPLSVVVSANKNCTATFNTSPLNYTVTVNKTGSGTVTGTGGIDCGTTCVSSSLPINSTVNLSAVAATDYTFSGWSGAGCSGSFTLDSNKTCTATFTYVTPPPPTYYFAVTVNGSGTVTTDSINCPSDCSEEYTSIATHTLTATPNTGYRFVSWGNSCSGTTSTTTITVDTSKTCTAKFEAIPTTQVSISTTGTGTGTVSVSPAGTSCGVNCYRYEQNTAVTLTAKESTGNRFVKWTGSLGCSNLSTNPLTLTLDTNKACIAQIDKVPSYPLTINIVGQGSVSTSGGELNCGVNSTLCQASFNEQSNVQLIATANPSWGFSSWSGDADCADGIVNMDAAHSCTANFAIAGSLEFNSVTAAYWAGTEGETVTIPVKRLNGTAGQVSVTYTVTAASSASNPATLSEDVEAATGTLTWVDGDSSDKFLTVNLLSDRLNESTEQFNVVLSNPQGGATLSSNNIATVSIFDTAAFSSIQIATADYYVNELDSTVLILVTRAASSVGDVSVNYQTSNGTATTGEDFSDTKGTLTWASGDSNLRFIEIPIQVDGLNEETETFNLELTAVTGANAQFGTINKAIIHIINTPVGGQGLVQFSTSTYNAAEADGIATINFNRLGGSEGAISADVSVIGGTASVNVDYKMPVSSTVNWAAGDAQAKTLQYPLNADTVVEGTESLQLQLSNAQGGATIGAISKATLQIADSTGTPSTSQDSTQPRVYFAQSIYQVSESDAKVLLEVKRAGDLTQTLTVSYQTRDGDAIGNVDYVSMQNTLTFAPNDGNSQWITIPIYSDTLTESDEQFNVALYNPSENSVLAVPATTTVQISNSIYSPPTPATRAGTVYLALQSYSVEENQKQLTIDVVRADGSDGEVRINYQLLADTAQEINDFEPDKGELIWADGESGTKTLKIVVVDDDVAEAEERFNLAISLSTSDAMANQGVTLGSAQATIKIVDDDSTTIQFKDNVSVKEVYENDGAVKINISRVGGKTGEIGVQYELVEKPNISNAAKINVDYYAGSKGSLIWRNQETADKTLEITLIDNAKAEDTRELNIELFNVSGDAKLGVPNILRLLIKDNDNAKSCKTTLSGTTSVVNCFYSNDGAELESPRIDIYGTLQGGTLSGTIKNLGTIDGTSPHEITLLPNTLIDGGILSGTFNVKDKNGNTGTASLQNVTVLAGSELRNLLIDKGSTVSSSAKLCRGTLFDNNSLIPASLNLNCMLNPADTFNLFDAVNGIDLSEDIVKNGVTGGILAAINKLLLEKNGEGYQLIAYQNGYYVLITPTELRLLRPSHIQQFSRQLYKNGENVALVSDIPLGMTYELEGSIQFVTHTGRQIWMQPVAYLPLLSNYLANYGLQASMLSTGSLQVTAINDALNYFATRSQGVISIGSSFGSSGIFTRMGIYGIEVIVSYEIQAGVFVEQVFAPTTANETELMNALTITGKASPTFFNNGIAELPTSSSTGEITTIRGRWDYVVRKNAHTDGKTSIVPLLDVNGDGLSDFEVRYANGDSQQLFGVH